MSAYFLRRFLLIPPTLIGITLVVFLITRFAPGGPVEQAIMESQMASEEGGGAAQTRENNGNISEEQMQQLKAYFGYDKPAFVAYLDWLGKVVRGDLGDSFRYGEPVAEVIGEALPVTLTYGLISLFIAYSVSIPLGIAKAMRHRTFLDTSSSVIIFIGYAIPGYAIGALMVVYLAARLRWFPMGGFTGPDWPDLPFWGKLGDFAHHAVLPLACYILGGFAFTTLLVKNQLMDNLAADYVRTAVAKGVSFRTAVMRHAFRNSLIPLMTDISRLFAGLIVGSVLIETIFDISGMGLLFYNAVVNRDPMIVMGILLIEAVLLLIGNIVGDVMVALTDPRVRFR